jgi:hypothetical protein
LSLALYSSRVRSSDLSGGEGPQVWLTGVESKHNGCAASDFPLESKGQFLLAYKIHRDLDAISFNSKLHLVGQIPYFRCVVPGETRVREHYARLNNLVPSAPQCEFVFS